MTSTGARRAGHGAATPVLLALDTAASWNTNGPGGSGATGGSAGNSNGGRQHPVDQSVPARVTSTGPAL
jgi:hypothetical protein